MDVNPSGIGSPNHSHNFEQGSSWVMDMETTQFELSEGRERYVVRAARNRVPYNVKPFSVFFTPGPSSSPRMLPQARLSTNPRSEDDTHLLLEVEGETPSISNVPKVVKCTYAQAPELTYSLVQRYARPKSNIPSRMYKSPVTPRFLATAASSIASAAHWFTGSPTKGKSISLRDASNPLKTGILTSQPVNTLPFLIMVELGLKLTRGTNNVRAFYKQYSSPRKW
jgi:hypothetical protein